MAKPINLCSGYLEFKMCKATGAQTCYQAGCMRYGTLDMKTIGWTCTTGAQRLEVVEFELGKTSVKVFYWRGKDFNQ